jgi:hypothetical protein
MPDLVALVGGRLRVASDRHDAFVAVTDWQITRSSAR